MSNKRYSAQEAVNPAYSVKVFGASALTPPRCVRSTVDRSFKVTFYDGTRIVMPFTAGQEVNAQIISISTSNGSAISSISNLIHAWY